MIWHSLKLPADSGEELSEARRQNIDGIILKLQAIGEQQVISISACRLTMAVAGGIVIAPLNCPQRLDLCQTLQPGSLSCDCLPVLLYLDISWTARSFCH